MNKALDFFVEFSKEIPHGNDSYYNHCYGVYKILQSLGCDDTVCLAGLYHSIYGTEYYQIPRKLHPAIVSDLIGEDASRLVNIFCGLANRYNSIISNSFKFDYDTHRALLFIEYANLKEQLERNFSVELSKMCDRLSQELVIQDTVYKEYTVSSKEIYVFDDLLDPDYIDFLNSFCLNSVYKPGHSSDPDTNESDSRFACIMSKNDLEKSKLISVVEKIARTLNTNIHIGHHYINHYSIMNGVSKHVDSSEPNHMTILLFPNKYWESGWGGEIVFYDKSEKHSLFEYKPGRVIVFDSRIPHKVMPTTQLAKKSRYSIAIKCSTDLGLDSLKEIYPNILLVRGENV